MKLISQGHRNDQFSDDLLYRFDSIKSAQDVGHIIEKLNNDQHNITSYRINYIYDRDDFKPSVSFDKLEDLLKFYSTSDIDEIDNVAVDSIIDDRKASTIIYVESGLVYISIAKKNAIDKEASVWNRNK